MKIIQLQSIREMIILQDILVPNLQLECWHPTRGNYYSLIGTIGFDDVEAALYANWSANGLIFKVFIQDILVPNLQFVVFKININYP